MAAAPRPPTARNASRFYACSQRSPLNARLTSLHFSSAADSEPESFDQRRQRRVRADACWLQGGPARPPAASAQQMWSAGGRRVAEDARGDFRCRELETRFTATRAAEGRLEAPLPKCVCAHANSNIYSQHEFGRGETQKVPLDLIYAPCDVWTRSRGRY